MFNIGDRVVCVESKTGKINGKEGTVKRVIEYCGEVFLRVRFDHNPSLVNSSMYSWRFQHEDKELAALSPVCRKIRQMEKRHANYQLKKAGL